MPASAAGVVDGRVRKQDGRVRVSARLVAVPDGSQLSSDAFDRTPVDTLAVQEEIAHAIADSLSLHIANGGRVAGSQASHLGP